MERELQSVQVVGLGQACVDYVGRVPVYPVEDSKMELEGLFISCGGPAATALVTLARLGVPTSFWAVFPMTRLVFRLPIASKKSG